MYKLRDRETRIFWDLSLFLTLKRRFSERRHTKKGVKSVATTKKVQLPEGFDHYDMRLKRQFSDQADKMNVIALSRKNYNLCVCLTCQYSEQNGDFNRCPFKSCRLCTDTVHHIRSICDKGVQLPKKADYADFVL